MPPTLARATFASLVPGRWGDRSVSTVAPSVTRAAGSGRPGPDVDQVLGKVGGAIGTGMPATMRVRLAPGVVTMMTRSDVLTVYKG
ncbi:hypothetical protein GCM10023214_76870 [Amycolatopsis dongchuanensis]|uniref:Uncharacterized protein n=1 Tax=Amycolatopsis dongchuanensis TaxID=1070866 RepID=A0ABP8VSH3_9PSEU